MLELMTNGTRGILYPSPPANDTDDSPEQATDEEADATVS